LFFGERASLSAASQSSHVEYPVGAWKKFRALHLLSLS
jgi:hypothetical protein